MKYYLVFAAYERLGSTNDLKFSPVLYTGENLPDKRDLEQFVQEKIQEKYSHSRFHGITGITEISQAESQSY